jgi:hypothetical protein
VRCPLNLWLNDEHREHLRAAVVLKHVEESLIRLVAPVTWGQYVSSSRVSERLKHARAASRIRRIRARRRNRQRNQLVDYAPDREWVDHDDRLPLIEARRVPPVFPTQRSGIDGTPQSDAERGSRHIVGELMFGRIPIAGMRRRGTRADESLHARLYFDAKLNLQDVATSLDPWRVFEDSTHHEGEADLHPVHRVMERVAEKPWLIWSPRFC